MFFLKQLFYFHYFPIGIINLYNPCWSTWGIHVIFLCPNRRQAPNPRHVWHGLAGHGFAVRTVVRGEEEPYLSTGHCGKGARSHQSRADESAPIYCADFWQPLHREWNWLLFLGHGVLCRGWSSGQSECRWGDVDRCDLGLGMSIKINHRPCEWRPRYQLRSIQIYLSQTWLFHVVSIILFHSFPCLSGPSFPHIITCIHMVMYTHIANLYIYNYIYTL